MPNYYVYLISSLPFLRYGEKAPLSFGRFISMCAGMIPEDDMRLIEMIKNTAIYDYSGSQQTLRRWRNYEISLRNEIVRVRASRRHIDPLPYLRPVEEGTAFSDHTAINAYRAANPLESEKILDQARWHLLDELSSGHYFDIDLLITYACKLMMLEKWDAIRAANNPAAIEKFLA